MEPDKDEVKFQKKMIIGAVVLLSIVTFPLWMTKCQAGVFGEIGQSRYEKPPCMLWHRECAGFYTTWDMKQTMFRLGYDYKGFRISYADLGKYSFVGDASDNETCVLNGGGTACPGKQSRYFTSGSLHGLVLSYRGVWNHLFLEAGPVYFRQAFKEEKDDGFSFQETQSGLGYMAGVGIDFKPVSVGVYTYQSKVAGKFHNGDYPSGTGGAYVFTVGYQF